MSSVKRLDADKLRARRIIATASLTAVAAAFLLLNTWKAPVSVAPLARGLSHQAADKQVPSGAPEAEQTAAVQTPMELEPMELEGLAVVQSSNDPPADQIAGIIPVEPARLEPQPAANTSPPGSEQRLYKSRRALETVDAREFLRRATAAK
jgi:hypothetical protein